MAGRLPEYDLCIIDREGGEGGFQNIGVGWSTRDGRGVALKLNKGVTLTWRDMDDHALYVFKRTERQEDDGKNQRHETRGVRRRH